jgi:pimeloyl-ACP methyl ester carboxylesterase
MSAPSQRLLLIHGFGSSFAHGWVETGWVDILADYGWQAPAIDLPGHGSWAPLRDPAAFGDVPETLFSSLPGRPPFSAVGFSMGAQMLVRMAIAHPDAFDRIVLMGMGDSVFDPNATEPLRQGLSAPRDPANVAIEVFHRMIESNGGDLPSLLCFLEQPRSLVTAADLGRITCPVLVVLGERDEAECDGLLAGLADVRFVSLPGVDHFATPSDFTAIDQTLRFFGIS